MTQVGTVLEAESFNGPHYHPVILPGLNGIRAFASLVVLIEHIEVFKSYYGISSFLPIRYWQFLGASAVTVFFVLSGFLLTYLLLAERARTGTIHLLYFYARRVLRIWPVYFVVLLVATAVTPVFDIFTAPTYSDDLNSVFWERFTLFGLMLANVAFIYLPTFPYANILWSVAVEEQFYAFWPLLLKRFSALATIFGVLIGYMTIKFALSLLVEGNGSNGPWVLLALFWDRTRFSCMAIGGIAGYLLWARSSKLSRLFSHNLKYFALYLLCALLLSPLIDSRLMGFFLINELISVPVAILIANFAAHARPSLLLESFPMVWLGRISYGIYAYHLLCLVPTLNILRALGQEQATVTFNLILYSVTISSTLALAWLSYRFIESPFLRLKRSIAPVSTTDR